MPRNLNPSGLEYLQHYSSAEHMDGNAAFVIAAIFVIFSVYIVYRVRKQIAADEDYLKKKRNLVSKWSRNAMRQPGKMINKLRKK